MFLKEKSQKKKSGLWFYCLKLLQNSPTWQSAFCHGCLVFPIMLSCSSHRWKACVVAVDWLTDRWNTLNRFEAVSKNCWKRTSKSSRGNFARPQENKGFAGSVWRAWRSSVITQLWIKRPGLSHFKYAAWKPQNLPWKYTLCSYGFGKGSRSDLIPVLNYLMSFIGCQIRWKQMWWRVTTLNSRIRWPFQSPGDAISSVPRLCWGHTDRCCDWSSIISRLQECWKMKSGTWFKSAQLYLNGIRYQGTGETHASSTQTHQSAEDGDEKWSGWRGRSGGQWPSFGSSLPPPPPPASAFPAITYSC